MAVEGYKVWADVGNPGAAQSGTQVGTQIAAGTSGSLFWYLEKAGIKVGGDAVPTTGRIYPR